MDPHLASNKKFCFARALQKKQTPFCGYMLKGIHTSVALPFTWLARLYNVLRKRRTLSRSVQWTPENWNYFTCSDWSQLFLMILTWQMLKWPLFQRYFEHYLLSQVVTTYLFFSGVGKATFLWYFFHHAEFITGESQYTQSSLSDTLLDSDVYKQGILAFLRLIGIVYFKRNKWQPLNQTHLNLTSRIS